MGSKIPSKYKRDDDYWSTMFQNFDVVLEKQIFQDLAETMVLRVFFTSAGTYTLKTSKLSFEHASHCYCFLEKLVSKALLV